MPQPGLVGDRDAKGSERRDFHGGRGVGNVRHNFHRRPQPGVARERHCVEPQRDHVADGRGSEDRRAQRTRHLLARAGKGGGLRQGVVAHKGDGTAHRRGARHAGVADGVSRPVEPRILPVPKAHHPIESATRQIPGQLGPAHGGGRQFLVETGGEDDAGLVEQLRCT